MKYLFILLSFFSVVVAQNSATQKALIETTKGNIEVELYSDKAPKSVENFIEYAESGFYNDTIFHRVISGFMIQTGGLTEDMQKKTTREPIQNEADNGVSNARGTLAMARTGAPHSGSSQFFINLVDNAFLDFKSKDSGRTWGYAVFGKVTKGMDVVDTIAAIRTGVKGGRRDVPVQTVKIISVKLIDAKTEQLKTEQPAEQAPVETPKETSKTKSTSPETSTDNTTGETTETATN